MLPYRVPSSKLGWETPIVSPRKLLTAVIKDESQPPSVWECKPGCKTSLTGVIKKAAKADKAGERSAAFCISQAAEKLARQGLLRRIFEHWQLF